MTAAGTSRRRDVGAVSISARDVAALGMVGEAFALRDDVLAVVLGRLSRTRVRAGLPGRAGRLAPGPAGAALSRPSVSGWLDRMERARLITRRRLLGRTWAVATVAGLRLAGLPYRDAWTPTLRLLGHVYAVAVTRLELERHYPGAAWTSERALRSETARAVRAGQAVPGYHLLDGLLEMDGGRVGLEVELHRKRPDEYSAIVAALDPTLAEVWWFTPPGAVAPLRSTLETPAPALDPLSRFGVPVAAAAVSPAGRTGPVQLVHELPEGWQA